MSRRLFRDPERWADVDMVKRDWLQVGLRCAIIALVLTVVAIALGVWVRG